MLRKLVLLGAFVGSSASVPILYQSNPDAFVDLLRGTPETQEEAPVQVSMLRPSLSVPKSEAMTGRKVRLAADRRGHFSADFRINGRSIEGMIDTGATLVAMNETTARRVGIRLTLADFRHQVETANGKARAAAATIEEMTIGRIAVRDVQAVVLEDKALSGMLVGVSFLKGLRRYQVEDGALILEQ